MINPKPTVIIQSYAPTTNSNIEELEEFYEELKNTVKGVKHEDIVFTMGDFNANIDINYRSTAAGKYCFGVEMNAVNGC